MELNSPSGLGRLTTSVHNLPSFINPSDPNHREFPSSTSPLATRQRAHQCEALEETINHQPVRLSCIPTNGCSDAQQPGTTIESKRVCGTRQVTNCYFPERACRVAFAFWAVVWPGRLATSGSLRGKDVRRQPFASRCRHRCNKAEGFRMQSNRMAKR